MRIEVSEEKAADLEGYALIRMSFEVRQVLDVAVLNDGLGGFTLSERKLQAPYLRVPPLKRECPFIRTLAEFGADSDFPNRNPAATLGFRSKAA